MIVVSVIIPFHKHLHKLVESVQSVVFQRGIHPSYKLEIVVSNDSYHSIDIIESILNHLFVDSDCTLIVVNNPELPCAGFNRNCAIRNSTGQLVAFLDSDDIWLPFKLSKQLELISSGYNFITTSYFVSEKHYLQPPSKITNKCNAFFLFKPIGTSTVLLSRDLITNIEFSNLKFSQDILFWAQVLRQPHLLYSTIFQPLVVYSRSGRTSTSSAKEQIFYYYNASYLFSKSVIVAFLSTAVYIMRSIFRPIFFLVQYLWKY